jgi:hypothetical protein
MCFAADSRPPIAPIAGGALDGALITLTSEDGAAFTAFRARPARPGKGAILVRPDRVVAWRSFTPDGDPLARIGAALDRVLTRAG